MRLSPASASRLRGIFVCISGILWYNIGREFPIGGVRMNTLSRTEIEQVIRELLHKYHAEYALLFGSYARSAATSRSDVDLWVDSGLRGLSFFGLLEDVCQSLHCPVDLIDRADVIPGSPVDREIRATGVVLYEQ